MFNNVPVVQIHLSRFCNLSCLHCYSSSGPTERQALPVDDVLRTTAGLSEAGYRRTSLSGGEPVLAPGFLALASGLTLQGFQVGLVSNGTRPEPLIHAMNIGAVQHASISFDGPEPIHDEIRGRKGAFGKALRTLERLADAGLSCGALISVTQHALPYIPDLVDTICAAGAGHVQLHPIAATGRAKAQVNTIGPELPTEALLRLLAIGRLLQRLYPSVQFQVDVVLKHALRQVASQEGDLISPLVIADDGALLPFCFDISRDFTLGRLGEQNVEFRLNARLRDLLDKVSESVSDDGAVNFYRELVYCAQQAAAQNVPG